MKYSARLALLAALLFAEKFVLDALVDAGRAQTALGVGALVRHAQHWGFRYLVTFLAAAAVFAFVRATPSAESNATVPTLPEARLRWLLLHALLVVALGAVSYLLYRADVSQLGFASLAAVWVLLCAAAILAAGAGFMPAPFWLRGIRSIGIKWVYAAAVALLGTSAWAASEGLWQSATALTFKLVHWILLPVLPLLSADPVTHVISTANFAVEITQVCSGLEGLGLTLAFTAVWLLCFRREYIFPRALILVPLSLIAIFGLNVFRIAALLLIGNAGYPEVAAYGFHSQAGWIAFNAVACALVFFSRRSSWLNQTASNTADSSMAYNPTATYLVPLLAVLAAGTLSHAFSGKFESLYPLRLIAGCAALFVLRRPLRAIPWRCTWRGPAVGCGVFLVWIIAAYWLLPAAQMPEPLIAMPPLQVAVWIASRCLTSVALVPIAEELAYRGYLMRRLVDAEFEAVSYTSVRWPVLAVTAIVFGAAHGSLWLPGILAGLAYGLLVIRRETLGEAVAAHATTNGLIAVTVLAGGQWQLW